MRREQYAALAFGVVVLLVVGLPLWAFLLGRWTA